MRFANREQAGRFLAKRLTGYEGRHDVVVFGLARGGVPVAFEVAKSLGVPLDVFLLRKLGVPGHEELAFGAVASGGVHVLDQETIDAVGLSPAEMQETLTNALKELARQERIYQAQRAPLDPQGKTVILIDDGIATGSSMRAAIAAFHQRQAARVVVAVPVAPLITCQRLQKQAGELACVYAPETFYAVGAFYSDFSQVTDGQVVELLRRGSLETNGKVA